jgi:hypothetical protein
MEKLVERLKELLKEIKNNGSEVESKLKSIIEDVSNSKCDNTMFCGMDKKW